MCILLHLFFVQPWLVKASWYISLTFISSSKKHLFLLLAFRFFSPVSGFKNTVNASPLSLITLQVYPLSTWSAVLFKIFQWREAFHFNQVKRVAPSPLKLVESVP